MQMQTPGSHHIKVDGMQSWNLVAFKIKILGITDRKRVN